MAATKQDLIRWFERGKAQGSERMIIWCDTYDYDDFPEFSDLTGVELQKYVDAKNGTNMLNLMEVYDLTAPIEPQMEVRRAYNY